ncbi:MAG TPA: hypothetical protein VE866_11130, partial [Candidatus Binatia bacterium]|nr:hypothetical protein [Candidatus Binatia bacterium]
MARIFGWVPCIAVSFASLTVFLFLPLTAEAALPRVAISIPTAQTFDAGLQAAEQCGVPDKVIVLPPLPFDFARSEEASSVDVQALGSIPQGVEAWLHVVVHAGSLTGKESEREIAERVDAFVKSLPLSAVAVRGLMVEIQGPLAADDLFAYGLIRMALTIKGSNAGLRLAFVFPQGFIGGHGDIVRRLAIYSDLLGLTYGQGWRQDAASIAEHALNKPIILKLDSEASATPSSFLTAILAAGPSVEIVWAEPPDAKAASALCVTNNFLNHAITSSMYAADSATSSFHVAVDAVRDDEHRWFVGGPSDVVIVARVNASPDSPKTVRLQGVKPGLFEIKWYDAATGSELQAGEATRTDRGLAQTCVYTSEYALISIHRQSDAGLAVSNIVEVKSRLEFSVEEIIARWQQNR